MVYQHVLHTIPSGIFHPSAINLIGNGVVIDPVIFKGELDKLAGFNIDFAKNYMFQKRHTLSYRPIDYLMPPLKRQKEKQKLVLPLKELVQLIWTKRVEMEFA